MLRSRLYCSYRLWLQQRERALDDCIDRLEDVRPFYRTHAQQDFMALQLELWLRLRGVRRAFNAWLGVGCPDCDADPTADLVPTMAYIAESFVDQDISVERPPDDYQCECHAR